MRWPGATARPLHELVIASGRPVMDGVQQPPDHDEWGVRFRETVSGAGVAGAMAQPAHISAPPSNPADGTIQYSGVQSERDGVTPATPHCRLRSVSIAAARARAPALRWRITAPGQRSLRRCRWSSGSVDADSRRRAIGGSGEAFVITSITAIRVQPVRRRSHHAAGPSDRHLPPRTRPLDIGFSDRPPPVQVVGGSHQGRGHAELARSRAACPWSR